MIVADLSSIDTADALQILLQNRGEKTQIIILADKKQLQMLCADSALSDITDIWITPMSDEEIRFRF